MPRRVRRQATINVSRPPAVARRYGRYKNVMRSRIGKGARQPVQFFKRSSYTASWLTTSPTVDTFKNLEFSLNGVPNSAEFTNLYDQYMIKGVKVHLIPRFNVAQAGGGSTPFSLPSQVYSILDFDGTFPATIPEMMQYENLKMSRGTSVHTRYLKPAVLPTVYTPSPAGAYGVKKNQWIDCNNSGVPHYGMTIGIPACGADNLFYDLKVDLYLAFKNVR